MKLNQEELYLALCGVLNRIEAAGASPELTDASMYVSDLRQAVGNQWNPADTHAAERILDRIGGPRELPPGRMSFGKALEAMERGQRVARAGWNGKGMFAYLVPAASYPVQTGAAKAHFGEGSIVPYNAYLALKTVDDTVSTWVPSVNDCLAKDWTVLDTPAPSC